MRACNWVNADSLVSTSMTVTPRFHKASILIQCFLSPCWIPIIPEFLQRILENVYRGQVLVQFKQSFEFWFFIGKQICFVLQEQIFTPLDHLFSLGGGLLVFQFPNLVDHSPEGFDHVELIKDNTCLWAAFIHCLDIGIPGVHGNRFDPFTTILMSEFLPMSFCVCWLITSSGICRSA
jgi:hypothetical protein